MISLQEFKNLCYQSQYTKYQYELNNNQYISVHLINGSDIEIETLYQIMCFSKEQDIINKTCLIRKEYVHYFELINQLKQKQSFILAIDGMCASGKSTLAKLLGYIFKCPVFHMDDFYLPLEMRTESRLQLPGGNVDYERFHETVLKPFSQQQDIIYQAFDCTTMSLQEPRHITYHRYCIVEGSYALRPELVPYYTDQIVLQISFQQQIDRLTKRNPQSLEQFIQKWIPLENKYFRYYHIYENYPVINNGIF